VDETVQIRGGRGYETAASLAARGEAGLPVERLLRDVRINLILEGTSQIMRLFIAREALDVHLRVLGRLLSPRASGPQRLATGLTALGFYGRWYPRLWLAWGWWPRWAAMGRPLAGHVRFVERTSRRLATALFHAALRHQTRLADHQQLLGRLVDVGADLFAMAAVCSRAQAMARATPSDHSPVELADVFCRLARRRVRHALGSLRCNEDRATAHTAHAVLDGRFAWLEAGILNKD
jgi:hypothetical protein